MNKYRTHLVENCINLQEGVEVKISGWLHNKRDHGGVLFTEIRDHTGIIQVVFDTLISGDLQDKFSKLRLESCVQVIGEIKKRTQETINANIKTGTIEIVCKSFVIYSESEVVPFQINSDDQVSEEVRMKYRFLDLRKEKVREKMLIRSKVISFLRKKMESLGFIEFQTPILTASSPEGAKDFLVPSSKHKGKFYALPQAPQQFKQLLMVSGFDKYFQIAPCFRDEAQRADRSPGEFYQLDIEMSFAEKQDVFNAITDVIYSTFKEFSIKKISETFKVIDYKTSMLKYGNDKPDLRNPIEIFDATEVFRGSGFGVFENVISSNGTIRGIPAPNCVNNPRSFFDTMIGFAQDHGAKGLAWVKVLEDGTLDGVPAKFINEQGKAILLKYLNKGDAVFFASGVEKHANYISGLVRTEIANRMNLIDKNSFEFCWIVDFPYFEYNDEDKKIDFCHNPFSKPNCTIEDLQSMSKDELLNITADQYDIVCNGIELSSGAVRNHDLNLMFEAFKVVGYSKEHVESNFPGMVRAFKFGVPPHAGIAPGVERMIMLLTDSLNIREVTLFPLTSSGEDLLMNAPSVISDKQLKDLGLKIADNLTFTLA